MNIDSLGGLSDERDGAGGERGERLQLGGGEAGDQAGPPRQAGREQQQGEEENARTQRCLSGQTAV